GSTSKVTINHDEIRRWVESKGGCPAHVKGTGRGSDPGVLRVDFPGYSGVETLEALDWDEWSRWFDKKKLAFVYQPTTRFSKLVARDSVDLGPSARATQGRATGAKRATAKRAATARKTKKPAARKATSTTRGATTGRGAGGRSTTGRA